jgi:hypothetical protein
MQVLGDYQKDGYVHLQDLLPREIGNAFLQHIAAAVGDRPIPLSGVHQYPNLLRRAAFEIYGNHFPPMLFFLWGLTPIVSQIVGRELLPTYDYFRVYRSSDICRVHCDRYSCQHSLSLTLDYSDGISWPLEIGTERHEPSADVRSEWGAEPHSAVDMQVGDAVLYQGVYHRHARTTPNPNDWSAHLFLHWVERDGPYADHAFDGQIKPGPIRLSFA